MPAGLARSPGTLSQDPSYTCPERLYVRVFRMVSVDAHTPRIITHSKEPSHFEIKSSINIEILSVSFRPKCTSTLAPPHGHDIDAVNGSGGSSSPGRGLDIRGREQRN